jgi:hypothetical protein
MFSGVRGVCPGNGRPVNSLNTPAFESLCPSGAEVHINEDFHSFPGLGKFCFPAAGKPCGVSKNSIDVIPFKKREILKEIFDRLSRAKLRKNHAGGNPHPSDARLPSHNRRIMGNAVKWFLIHEASIAGILRNRKESVRALTAPGVVTEKRGKRIGQRENAISLCVRVWF